MGFHVNYQLVVSLPIFLLCCKHALCCATLCKRYLRSRCRSDQWNDINQNQLVIQLQCEALYRKVSRRWCWETEKLSEGEWRLTERKTLGSMAHATLHQGGDSVDVSDYGMTKDKICLFQDRCLRGSPQTKQNLWKLKQFTSHGGDNFQCSFTAGKVLHCVNFLNTRCRQVHGHVLLTNIHL